MLQRRHVAEAAESEPARRAAVRALTQQLAEARREVSSRAAELAQSRCACAALRRHLSAQSADPPSQPLRAVIPLDDYLDLTEATLLCAEQLRAMSLASSDSGSQLAFPMRHQHAAHLGDSGEAVVPQPAQLGLASGKMKLAGMHNMQNASKADIEAASVASSEDSCQSWRACRSAAGVDSMLHALEAAIQSPGTPSNGLEPLTCSFSFLSGFFCQSGYLSRQTSSAFLRWCLQLHALCAYVINMLCSSCMRALHALESFTASKCLHTLAGITAQSPTASSSQCQGEQGMPQDELQSARGDIAAALRRRGELHAELERVHAELATARTELEDVRASQGPCEVLRFCQDIGKLRRCSLQRQVKASSFACFSKSGI
jgi:hypothetical protein